MIFLPVGHNTHREGTVSQIFDIGPSFDFMKKKKGDTFCNCFFDIYILFHKIKNNTSIKILRHRSLHIYHENI